MRFLIIFILFFIELNAKELTPTFIYEGSGGVTDLVYKDAKLYSATAEGAVDIYDTKEQKLIQTIKVPMIKDFTGEEVASKIYSVDIIDDNSYKIFDEYIITVNQDSNLDLKLHLLRLL